MSKVWLQRKTHQGSANKKQTGGSSEPAFFFMAEANASTDRQACQHEPQNSFGPKSGSTPGSATVNSSVESLQSGTSNTHTAQLGDKCKAVKNSSSSHTHLKNLPFTICHWNCGSGITKKLDDIQHAITELKPTVIYISEADRKKHHDDRLIQIKGYKLHNSESLEKHGKSRIIAYTRDNIHLKRRQDLESPDSEIIIFDLPQHTTTEVDRVVGLYRPFTGHDGDKSSAGTWDRFLHLLTTINRALEGCHRATIVGDFNVDLLKDIETQGRYAAALRGICNENSLEQLIHQPTRIQIVRSIEGLQIQESLLDHVYSSDYMSAELCGSMDLSQSDHKAIYIRYSNSHKRSAEKKVIYKRDNRQYSQQAMAALCRNEDWSSVFSKLNIQESYDILESKLQNIIDFAAPLRKIVICEKHPISNHSLRSLENRRRTLYKKMKNKKTSKSIEDYRKIKKKIKSKVKAVRRAEVSRMLKNRNMKNLWQGVNTICGRNTCQTEKLVLSNPESGVSTSNNKECADIFANVFKNKVDKLVEQVGPKDAMLDQISKRFDNSNLNIQFKTDEIVQIVRGFKNSGSSGPDGISINYVKDAIEELAPMLGFIFDKAALLAKIPVQWKTAKIIPLYKKGKKDNPENYRPISLLCSIGKIFEKCVLKFMTDSFGHSLPSSFQHGFRKNHSTTTAALTIQNSISKAMDRKKKVIVVSTDMSAAFDLLDKEVLLPRMEKLGIPANLVRIYENFLSERKAYVQCDQSNSEVFAIPVGCVQGSPSGPYLFTLLVDGISEYMQDVNIVAYADDMYFIFESNTWDGVAKIAAEKTNIAINWLKRSGMVINATKTTASYFASHELKTPPTIVIDGTDIELKKVLTVLGITFDHKLKWDVHVENILKEANSRTQAIRHVQQHLTRNECLSVAHGLFFSKFYYCSSVWLTDQLPRSLLQRLTTSSNSCLRAALGYRIKDISTSDLHLEAGVLTPYQRSFQDKAITFWRIINNCEPEDLYLELLNQGYHHERNKTFYLHQDNTSKIGRLAFANRLNDILSLLGDSWLDLSQAIMKQMLKNIILQKIPAKFA